MDLLHDAYLEIAPDLERYFIAHRAPANDPRRLARGSKQRFPNLRSSLTTTPSVIAALNSILLGALASDIVALLGSSLIVCAFVGAGASIVSAAAHLRIGARYRRAHHV